MVKNVFYFILKALFFLEIFFCLELLIMQKKRLDQKDKVSFKIYDVTSWLTNNYNTHIDHYLVKQKQPDNEIWSVNRIYQEKYFSSKIMENDVGRLVPDLFLFFEKALYTENQVVFSLVLIYSDSPQLGIRQKQTV